MNSLVDDPPLAAPPTQADIIAQLQQSVSPSRLTLFQSCRLKFFFRHVLRLQKPKMAALHVGVAVHQVLRAWNRARWRQEIPSPHLMYAAYTAAWIAGQVDEPVDWESPVEEEEQKQVGWRLLDTFFRESTLRSTDKPDGVEVAVEADLSAHGLPRLVGVLDLVQDGRIIDFKTASQTPSPEKAALLHATQVAAYSLLYRENTGKNGNGHRDPPPAQAQAAPAGGHRLAALRRAGPEPAVAGHRRLRRRAGAARLHPLPGAAMRRLRVLRRVRRLARLN